MRGGQIFIFLFQMGDLDFHRTKGQKASWPNLNPSLDQVGLSPVGLGSRNTDLFRTPIKKLVHIPSTAVFKEICASFWLTQYTRLDPVLFRLRELNDQLMLLERIFILPKEFKIISLYFYFILHSYFPIHFLYSCNKLILSALLLLLLTPYFPFSTYSSNFSQHHISRKAVV